MRALITPSRLKLTDAIFETTAGLTTSGASVIPDPSLLPTASSSGGR